MNAEKPRMRYRLLRSWVAHSRKVQWILRRMESTVGTWTEAILRSTLRDAEKEALSVELYDPSFRPEDDHEGLYAWERQWFERRLPPPPASLLIGAAGAGREAVALRSQGYVIHGFEPAGSAFRACQLALGSEAVDQASYQDLIATVLGGRGTRLRLTKDAEFDAVLLGWGSFGHVLRATDRLDLLRACDRIAPSGPILLSLFHPKNESESGETFFAPWGGFLAQPTIEELDRHAKTLSRELIVSLQSPSPYATLLPAAMTRARNER